MYFKNMTENEAEIALIKRVDRDLAHKAITFDGGTAVLNGLQMELCATTQSLGTFMKRCPSRSRN